MANRYSAPLDRFEQQHVPEPNSGCWLWIGSVNARGYGVMGFNGKTVLPHRWYFDLVKAPVPQGMHLDHLCRVPCCVNPDHLEIVTPAENARRGIAGVGGRARQLAKTHCPKGHAYSGGNLRVYSDGFRRCKECEATRDRLRYSRRTVSEEAKKAALLPTEDE